MKMKKYILIFTLLLALFVSCGEEETGPSGPKPGEVSILSVENIHGGAIISYKIPDDESLLYVQARYTVNGTDRVIKASYYDNELTVDGFADTVQYEVILEAVARGQMVSDPVTVAIQPKISPVDLMSESLLVISDWGGVRIEWENVQEETIELTILGKDSLGDLFVLEKEYSSSPNAIVNLRGYESIDTYFGFYFTDRWDNVSDTLEGIYIPKHEVKLDKSKMSGIALGGDTPEASASYGIDKLFVDDPSIPFHSIYTGEIPPLPVRITMDLGVVAQLSRYTQWQREGPAAKPTNFFFFHYSFKRWEVWGSTEPDPAGSMEGWFKIGAYDSYKPSGSPASYSVNCTDDDAAAGYAGEQCDIPINIPPVRYVRIMMYENWSGSSVAHLGEVSFWGEIIEE